MITEEFGERRRQQANALRVGRILKHVAKHTGARPTVLARQEAGTRGRAYRVAGHRSFKPYSFRGEPIDIGGAHNGIAIAPHVESAQLVALANDDVREVGHKLHPNAERSA